jgi:transcriptional accessory protein Tex/SPT6
MYVRSNSEVGSIQQYEQLKDIDGLGYQDRFEYSIVFLYIGGQKVGMKR